MIKYICLDCGDYFGLHGYPVDNHKGQKWCDRCGEWDADLTALSEGAFEKALKEKNEL